MRRLGNLFIFIIALFFFSLSFNQFNKNYERTFIRSMSYSKVYENTYEIGVWLNRVDLDESVEESFDTINQVIQTHGLTVYLTDFQQGDGEYERTVYFSNDVASHLFDKVYFLGDVDLSEIDLSDTSKDQYITNNLDKKYDNDAIVVDYLDKSYYDFLTLIDDEYSHYDSISEFEIRPLHHFVDAISEDSFFFRLSVLVDEEDIETVMQVLQDNLWMYSEDKVTKTSEDLLYQSSYKLEHLTFEPFSNLSSDSLPFSMFYISLVAFSLITYGYMANGKRELAIRKLHGNNTWVLFRRYMIPYLIENFVIYIVGNLLMWLFLIRSTRPLAYYYLTLYFPYAVGVIGSLLLVAMLVFTLVVFSIESLAIKYAQNSRVLFYGAMILMLVSSSLIIPNFVTLSENYHTAKGYLEVQKKHPYLDNQYILTYYDKTPSSFLGFQASIEFNREIHDNVIKIKEDFDLLFSDFITYEKYEDVLIEPVIFVNTRYLQDLDIYDINGNKMEFGDTYKQKHHLLVPISKKDSEVSFLFDEFDYDIVLMQDNTSFFGLEYTRLIELHNPYIYVLPEDFKTFVNFNFNIWDFNRLSLRVEDDQDVLVFNQGLVDRDFGNAAQMKNSNAVFKLAEKNVTYYRQLLFEIFVIYGLYLFVFSMTITKLFLEENRKELSIGYLHGIPYIKRYQTLYQTHIILAVVLFLFLKDKSILAFIFVSIITLFNIVMTLFMTRINEMKHLVGNIKGD